MDLDFFRGNRGLRMGWKGKGRQGGGQAGTNVSKKKCHVGSIHLLRLFLPSPLCQKKKRKAEDFSIPAFPKEKQYPPSSSSILFLLLLLHKTKRKEKEKKVHLHLPQFPCLTFHFSTLSFNHPLIHLSCPSPNFECSIISPNRILKSK